MKRRWQLRLSSWQCEESRLARSTLRTERWKLAHSCWTLKLAIWSNIIKSRIQNLVRSLHRWEISPTFIIHIWLRFLEEHLLIDDSLQMWHVRPRDLLVNYSVLVWASEVDLVKVWQGALREWTQRLTLSGLIQLLHLLVLHTWSRRRCYTPIGLVVLAERLILDLRKILLGRLATASIPRCIPI